MHSQGFHMTLGRASGVLGGLYMGYTPHCRVLQVLVRSYVGLGEFFLRTSTCQIWRLGGGGYALSLTP